MADFIKRTWTWIVLLLWNGRAKPLPPPEPPPEPAVEAPPPPTAPPVLPSPRKWMHRSLSQEPPYPQPEFGSVGQFYFREHILDQLPEYFRILKRMRKHDRDAYDLYHRIGAHIMPYWLPITDEEMLALSPWWRVNRPSFGAIALVGGDMKVSEDPDAKVYPRFFYFSKFKGSRAPADCERFDGDVYSCTAYFHDAREKGARRYFGAVPASFYVGITKGGGVQVLNQLLVSKLEVRAKKRHCTPEGVIYNRGNTFSIRSARWGIPRIFTDWSEGWSVPFLTPQARMREMFIMTANVYEGAQNSMIRVDAKKESMHAVFGVNVERTPYFFRDRDVLLNEHGNKLRIFHIVRPHNRGAGTVKMHFRGLRAFAWNGYQVKITVPGRDHIMLPELDVALEEAELLPPNSIGMGYMGFMLQKHIGGVPLSKALKEQRDQASTMR